MPLELGIPIIAGLIFALVLIRRALRRVGARKRRLAVVRKGSTSPLSARTEMRALDEAYSTLGPTTIREVEEQIPTIDESGNRWTLIRTRSLETVLGPIGPTEIERERRHTVPGYGHAYPVSATEYEVFQGRMRLRVDQDDSELPPRQS